MKSGFIKGLSLAALLLMWRPCLADTTDAPQIKIKQSGFIGLEDGAIVNGVKDWVYGESSGNPWITNTPLERLLFQYVDDITVTDHIRVVMAIECQLAFSYPYDYNNSLNVKQSAFTFYPDRAEGMYTLGDAKKLYLQFGFGYFPFRTNPDVKDLGEYLFRTGTYPTYVLNNFNRPYSRLLGLRADLKLFDCLRQDVLFTSATQYAPLINFTLTYLLNYNYRKIVDIGGGVSFCNIISADSNLTTPKSTGYYYLDANGDTSNYTFKGIKPMVRFAFDPKPLLPPALSALLGRDDFRVYGEACVTGWENYKNYDTSSMALHLYENRNDRALYMMGFNVPTFKALDVLSIEVEHMSNRYPNSTANLMSKSITSTPALPIPYLTPDVAMATPGQKIYPWFWAIYAKKTFLKKFALIALFAHDHVRPIMSDITYQPTEDVLERKGDWWWNVRLNVNY